MDLGCIEASSSEHLRDVHTPTRFSVWRRIAGGGRGGVVGFRRGGSLQDPMSLDISDARYIHRLVAIVVCSPGYVFGMLLSIAYIFCYLSPFWKRSPSIHVPPIPASETAQPGASRKLRRSTGTRGYASVESAFLMSTFMTHAPS